MVNELPSSTVLLAFALTCAAGLATGIGSAMAFFARRTNLAVLAVAMAFSAGVMLYVSFTEILLKAGTTLALAHGEMAARWLVALGFFGGIGVAAAIDSLIPKPENPHEVRAAADLDRLKTPASQPSHQHLLRVGIFTGVAIAVHNLPEGLATFAAALEDPSVGAVIAVAIALHNIPEGVSVSVPIFFATGSRGRAFLYSFLSGLAEPLGALLGYLVLSTILTETTMGLLFAAVAGVMVFISLDELLPTAREYGRSHQVLYGLVGGMALMALSLILLR